MKSSDKTGWLAVGSKGRIHYWGLIDELSPQKRVSACGRKQHIYSIIEPSTQEYCALCVKFCEADGIATPTQV